MHKNASHSKRCVYIFLCIISGEEEFFFFIISGKEEFFFGEVEERALAAF